MSIKPGLIHSQRVSLDINNTCRTSSSWARIPARPPAHPAARVCKCVLAAVGVCAAPHSARSLSNPLSMGQLDSALKDLFDELSAKATSTQRGILRSFFEDAINDEKLTKKPKLSLASSSKTSWSSISAHLDIALPFDIFCEALPEWDRPALYLPPSFHEMVWQRAWDTLEVYGDPRNHRTEAERKRAYGYWTRCV